MTEIITLIGDPGGGKSTLGAVLAYMVRFVRDDMPRFTNTNIGPVAQVIPDLHKFIAIKLINKDHREMFCLDDEAAQSGLESRGSGTKAAAIESRIITHSRKAGAWLVLVSQLKSMLDKRAQWVEDLSILCEATFEASNTGITPDSFHYTVFDSKLDVVNEFDLDTEDLAKHIWPQMDTYDIPDFERFKRTFINYYDIGPDDETDYREKMELGYRYAKAEGLSIPAAPSQGA